MYDGWHRSAFEAYYGYYIRWAIGIMYMIGLIQGG